MANTFFKAKGWAVGDSLAEDEALDTAKRLMAMGGDKLVLPDEVVIADAFENEANTRVVSLNKARLSAGVFSILALAQSKSSPDFEGRADYRLEWPRWAFSKCRISPKAPTRLRKSWLSPAPHDHRWWRFGGSRSEGRFGRPDVAYFDRWRREPGAARRQRTAWRNGPER